MNNSSAVSKELLTFFLFFCCNTWLAGSYLVPQPGMKPILPAVRTQSPNHWFLREFLEIAKV